MTRTEPAKRIGVVPSAAAQWEHPSGTSPSVSNLISIAKITGVAFEWLATARGPVRLDAAAAESSALSQICIAMDLFEEEVLMTVRRIPQKHRDVWLHCLQTVYPRT
jgi:transcriptional regulator with XRE-family HTH domain